MTRYRRCPGCGALAAVPAAPGGSFPCAACGGEVPTPAATGRLAKAQRVDADDAVTTPTPSAPVADTTKRPTIGAAWRVGALFLASLGVAVGFTGHVAWRLSAPEPAVVPPPPAVAAAPADALTPTNHTRRPTPRPAPVVVGPTATADPPGVVVADWRRPWTPFEPPGLRLRLSFPGELGRRVVHLPMPNGTVVEVPEVSGDEGPARYRVWSLPWAGSALTPGGLTNLLAGLRPEGLTPASVEAVGGQEWATWRFAAYDGREWTVHAAARAGRAVLLVRSLDRAAVNFPGFDPAAAHRRFLDGVELQRDD